MALTYKFVYFDVRGRGEIIRWIFAQGEQKYEDVRIKKEDWPALKATTPNGQLPYLEVDGKVLTQSNAIARFVARKTGLAGKDDFEAAQADALVDYVNDSTKGLVAAFGAPDEKAKAAIIGAYLTEEVQPFLKGFERHLQSNNNGEGFFVGKNPTWADLYVVVFLDELLAMNPNLLDNYMLLKAHNQRVHKLKGIKNWLLTRPNAPAFLY